MKEFWLLTKVLLKEKFRLDKSVKQTKSIKIAYIVLAIFALPFAALMFYLFMSIGSAAAEIGVVTEGLAILITMSQLIVLLFGIVTVLNTIYFSKDTEIVLYLPIKPQYAFAAKVSVVYFIELLGSVAMSVIFILSFMIGAGLGIGSYLAFVLVVLLLPLLPLLLSTILAIPLMFVVSFFKNKGMISTFVYIFLFIAFFAAYYSLIQGIGAGGESGNVDEIMQGLLDLIKSFANVFFPNLWLASFATLAIGPALLHLVYTIGLNLVLIITALLISSFVYNRSISKQLETPKSNSGTEQKYEQRGKLYSLIMRDLKSILRFPSLGFYCLMQVGLAPVMLIIFSTSMSSTAELGFSFSEIMNAEPSITAGVLIALLTFMSLAINYFATSSITRENENFYLMKIMPVDYRTQIDAKVALAVLCNELTLFVCVAIFMILFQFNILWSLLVFVICSLLGVILANVQVYLDLNKPNINWKNVTQGLKNNSSSLMSMLLSLGILAVLTGVFILFYWLAGLTSVDSLIWFMWAVIALLSIAGVFATRKLLHNNCNRLMERLFN